MALALLFLLAAPFAESPELVANGGFEQLNGDLPAQWDRFVAPVAEGDAPAVARLDAGAHAGRYAVLLETPQPYAREPFNNWSQNVLGGHSGKELRASAWVKTENAGGAALWVQCWQRDPLRVIEVANTGTATPVYGTTDWQEISLEFTVPSETDFMTVRCVLKGTGKAWFDDVALAPAEEAKPEESPAPEQEAPAAPETPEAPKTQDPEPMPQPEPEPEPEPAPEPAAETPMPEVDTSAIEAEIDRLRDTNAMLMEALKSMRTDNAFLLDSINELQTQIRALEETLNPPPPDPDATPPLVPREYSEESP